MTAEDVSGTPDSSELCAPVETRETNPLRPITPGPEGPRMKDSDSRSTYHSCKYFLLSLLISNNQSFNFLNYLIKIFNFLLFQFFIFSPCSPGSGLFDSLPCHPETDPRHRLRWPRVVWGGHPHSLRQWRWERFYFQFFFLNINFSLTNSPCIDKQLFPPF